MTTRNAIKTFTSVTGFVTDILSLESISSKFQENDALYNLKVKVEEGSYYYPDSRIRNNGGKCGASVT